MNDKSFYFLIISLSAFFLAHTDALAQNMTFARLTDQIIEDFKYTANNVEADTEDIVLSPLKIKEAITLLGDPRFYFVLGGAGAAFGGSFALDQTLRARFDKMSNTDANLLQDASYVSLGGATALLYGYGLYADDERARDFAITGAEGAGLASLFTLAIKAAFGRPRPDQNSSHTAFFKGGDSFVSGQITPMFALAAGISEYFDNKWYIAAPIYSAALIGGFGRMGHDAHWFSDIIGAALVGIGTTELLVYLHKKHAENPSRFRVFPVSAPSIGPRGQSNLPGAGIGLGFGW